MSNLSVEQLNPDFPPVMVPLRFLILLVVIFCDHGHCALKLANYFGDHMVLQRGPQQAVLWGTGDTEGGHVYVKVTDQGTYSQTVSTSVTGGHWKLKLPAQTARGPFTIEVSSSGGGQPDVTLRDVLFGDVWLCSGQSNMYFAFNSVMNATAELQNAHNFPDIRFTRAKLVQNTAPQDSMAFDIPWTGPNSRWLSSSSAVCWLFAEYLYPRVNYPIGLIESSWGGTPIEAWSPPQVFTDCAHHAKRGPSGHSVLWNSMINPLLSTTLYGALWYQGEANAPRASQYACLIESMVKRWRQEFHQNSMQQTSSSFPFGYVQLATTTHVSFVGGFPYERWAQTANYGYSPNPSLPNTFMAVAMDLPDYDSPRGAIHPRYKQDVAERLVLGALNVAYGHSDVDFQGPFPSALRKDVDSPHTLNIVYNSGHVHLTVKNTHGFDVCCSVHSSTICDESHDNWVAAPITHHTASEVTLGTSGCGNKHVVGVRYEWRQTPCEYKQCSLYDSATGLPAPPYISLSLTTDEKTELVG